MHKNGRDDIFRELFNLHILVGKDVELPRTYMFLHIVNIILFIVHDACIILLGKLVVLSMHYSCEHDERTCAKNGLNILCRCT